jgi:tRNA-specific 2-thiouridylase
MTIVSRREKGKKVYVGMSGGVDSSVSVALLQDAGYDVTGVFIKVWQPDFLDCTAREDREDAMRVAVKLCIPFKTLSLEDEYKKEVVDYMISEYEKGRTPNPDVMCNKFVKFGKFYDWALGDGADFIATGHYAETDGKKLLKAKDGNKDQTYFLWKLTADKLSHILFPVSGMEKSEVREIARTKDLSVAEKKDSQGVCFIGKMDMKEFLGHFVESAPGDILDAEGNVIGRHDGALFYTIGQRRGFDVVKKTPDAGAYFIISKDMEANTITVLSKKEREGKEEKVAEILLEDINWISGTPADGEYECRFRYRQPLIKCELRGNKAIFKEPQTSVNPGQSLVLYDGEVCVGGGVIS